MPIGQTFSLAELVALKGAETVNAILQRDFACARNSDIERFLHKTAVRFEQANLAKTFLIFDDNAQILAYFTLSFRSIFVKTSKSLLKKLTAGFSNDNKINVFLLGQIGKNSNVKNNPIRLSDILISVFAQIEIAQRAVGGRVIILECENKPKLIQLYEQNGFKLIETVEDKHLLKTLFIIPKFNNVP